MSRAVESPSGGGDAVEVALLLFVVVAVGPLAMLAAALLAAAARTHGRIWLWLASMPAAAAGFLLWHPIRRHLEAALAAVHDGIAAHPAAALAAAWPHLWPAWLATLAVSPLLALALLLRRGNTQLAEPVDEKRRRRAARREQKLARQAQATTEVSGGDGVFLGLKLAGDGLLPVRRGRVHLPLPRLSHHLLVAGATGSGKTETALRIAYSAARASDWSIVYIDAKGDRDTSDRFAALMQHAGRRTWSFPTERHGGWKGTAEEVAGRLLQLIDFAHEGGGAYYRDLAVNTVRLACDTPNGPPRSSAELLARLQRGPLLKEHTGNPAALAEVRALQPEHLDGIRARYAAFFTTVAGALDGEAGFDEIDTAYFLLDGLRLKYEAAYLARFLVEDFTQWAAGRKPRSRRVLLIVDEFSAIAEAGQGLVDVVERTRGFGVATILCPQLAEGMGSPQAAARIIGSVQTILLHATPMPEQFVSVAGTRRINFTTRQLEGDAYTGLGSTRVEHEFAVDPNDVRRLRVGQCFAIGSGQAMKLQIAPAPSSASLSRT